MIVLSLRVARNEWCDVPRPSRSKRTVDKQLLGAFDAKDDGTVPDAYASERNGNFLGTTFAFDD